MMKIGRKRIRQMCHEFSDWCTSTRPGANYKSFAGEKFPGFFLAMWNQVKRTAGLGGLHFGSARHLKEAAGQTQSPGYLPGKIPRFSPGLVVQVKDTTEVRSSAFHPGELHHPHSFSEFPIVVACRTHIFWINWSRHKPNNPIVM